MKKKNKQGFILKKMKKENSRELTLEKLKKRQSIVSKMYRVASIIAILGCLLTLILITFFGISISALFSLYSAFSLFFIMLLIILNFVYYRYRKQISLIENETKVTSIKEKAKNGNLKEFVTIKDREITSSILIENIDSIVFKGIQDSYLVIDVYLKGNHFLLIMNIPINSLINSLDEEILQSKLAHLVDSVTVENLESETMTLKIRGKGFCFEETQITDDDLLEIFELKS